MILNRPQAVLAITAVVLALFGVVIPCAAAPLNVLGVVYGIDDGSGTTLFEQDLLFVAPRFDPALGTLDALLLSVIRGAVSASVTADSETPISAVVFHDDVSAVANTTVAYAAGTLAFSQVSVDIGPIPGVSLPPDSDGFPPDFVGDDALTFSGPISGDNIDAMIVTPSVLADFTGLGSVLLTLTITEFAGGSIPGLVSYQASYGKGVGVIGLAYEYTPSEPAPVPESRTLMLLGLSSAVFVLQRIRQRRRC
jgi:hypothetical protein